MLIRPSCWLAFATNGNFRKYSIVKMTSNWMTEKIKISSLSIEDKRKTYRSNEYVILDKVDPWHKYVAGSKDIENKKHTQEDLNEFRKIKLNEEKNAELAEKVSIFRGDITKLEFVIQYPLPD
ncbi:unnamed protein product [Leptidea sinapis]|uniref:Uncharacterized protein n=1 Tax=Leptidea sinapis TaxID=189913 RepID=A0A5E4QTG3_9NEOP|nr:unnamed protein product [Leptidea sinapis]